MANVNALITSLRGRYAAALAIGASVPLLYVVWLLSARFGVQGPSIIDDWGGAARPGTGIGDLLDAFVTTGEGQSRFRPGWELFDYVQWHAFGSPQDMTWPDVWNVLRIGIFAVAIALIAGSLARTARPDLRPVTVGFLAAVPALMVVTGGTVTSIDLVRLGPQEPLLVGASLGGAGLIVLGLDRILRRAPPAPTVVALVAGELLWLLGIFQKEASLALLVLLPFVYAALVQHWRERSIFSGPLEPLRDWRVLAAAAALLVPLLWMTLKTGSVSDEGASLYGAPRPEGISEWIQRLEDAARQQWGDLTPTLGTGIWRGLGLGLPFLGLAIALDRRRIPWLAIGFFLTAWAFLLLEGIPLVVVSRYYIPTIALFALATAVLLAQSRAWLRWTALLAGLIWWWNAAGPARDAAEFWAQGEKNTAAAVERIATYAEQGCDLYMASLDVERAEALPRLVGFETDRIAGPCPHGEGVLVVPEGAFPNPVTIESIGVVCAEPGYGELERVGGWLIQTCAEFQTGPDARAARQADRLVPGVGFAARQACLERTDIPPERCDEPRLDRDEPWP